MTKIEQFKLITAGMTAIYEEKNENYGNSFDKSLDEDGLLVAKIRLGDKYNRFVSLLKQKSTGTKDESIVDTLVDLANYAIMTISWMKDQKDKYESSPTKVKEVDVFYGVDGIAKAKPIKNKVGFT